MAVRVATRRGRWVTLPDVTEPERKGSGVPEWLIVVPLFAASLIIAVIFTFL